MTNRARNESVLPPPKPPTYCGWCYKTVLNIIIFYPFSTYLFKVIINIPKIKFYILVCGDTPEKRDALLERYASWINGLEIAR